ncbi:MAG TPA: DUF1150 family protein [Candidatus Cybelea sp.]|nr:DUF1150 family protein [Candidatus Cybelea sp.]
MDTNRTVTAYQQIPAEAFAMLGAPTLAYVRPVQSEMGAAWGVFAANGQQIGVVANRDVAHAAARQNDLEPVDVN